MDWNALTQEMAAASRRSFSRLLAAHGDEHFYAFILYTDDDCYTAVPAANSVEQLKRKLVTLKIDEDDAAPYQWYSAEWAYEACDLPEDGFSDICRKLSAECNALSDNEVAFLGFKKRVHACMTQALHALDREAFFGARRNDMVLFISSSDDDDVLDIENESAKQLNPPSVYQSFLRRFPGID